MIQIHCRGGATVTASKTPGPPGGSSRRPRASSWAWLKPRLSGKYWAGVGAIAAILGLVPTIAVIFIGSGSSASYSNKEGNCVAQGNGNTVTCSRSLLN